MSDALTDFLLARIAEDERAVILALPYADHPDYQQEWRP